MAGRGRSLDTDLIHAGEPSPRIDGAVRVPIFQTAMYEVAADDARGVRYIRYTNTPNHEVLEKKLAALEHAEAGLVTGSGMAAISAALLSVLGGGRHVLMLGPVYGGTHQFATAMLPGLGISYTMLDGRDPDGWEKALTPETAAVYTESITNPLIEVPDHAAVVAFARAHGLVSIIDNTFATPVNFRPVAHGYDLVVHSATKYLNGHSDVVAGAVLGRAEAIERCRWTLINLGGALDPHAAFLVHRGMATLAVRVRHQNDSALKVARFLSSHSRVRRVSYPGLQSHPDHGRARTLFEGFGGMLAFELDGGSDAAARFMADVTIPISAPSLGGVETLLSRPVETSHARMSADERAALGITESLIRCSIGLEGADDLIDDLARALD
jgi:cystathionine beta-lyase/cystathionine gamma-synthase